jgi:hypothetical protein
MARLGVHPFRFRFACRQLTVDRFTMVRVIRQCGINLTQRELRMIQRQFFGAPAISNVLANEMNYFEVLPCDEWTPAARAGQMRISDGFERHVQTVRDANRGSKPASLSGRTTEAPVRIVPLDEKAAPSRGLTIVTRNTADFPEVTSERSSIH